MITPHRKWLPVIDEDLCTGCAACVEACGPKSLEIVNHLAMLVRPDTCGSEEHCIAPCPTGAIHMVWVEYSGNLARGNWSAEGATATTSIPSPDTQGAPPRNYGLTGKLPIAF